MTHTVRVQSERRYDESLLHGVRCRGEQGGRGPRGAKSRINDAIEMRVNPTEDPKMDDAKMDDVNEKYKRNRLNDVQPSPM